MRSIRLHSRLNPVVLALGVALFLADRLGAAPESTGPTTRPATTTDLERLLARTYLPVPDRFHFRASLMVLSPSWTEAEVDKELRAQTELMRDHDRQLSPAQRRELQEVRRDGIRRARSGTNVFDLEVWVSGELYRKDETWTNIRNSSKRSYVQLGEPRFTNVLSYIVNESVGSVTVYTNLNWPVSIDRLWEGYSLEPELTLPVLMALGRVEGVPPSTEQAPLRNFDGLDVVLDDTKARQLIEGTHPDCALRLADTLIEGARVVRYRFEFKQPARGEQAQVTYWLDATNRHRLYRVESQVPGAPLLVSTRSGHDDTGWPRVWTSQSVDARGRVITRRVEYLHGLDQDFDDWEVFAPVFPSDYLVSVSSGAGMGQLIQNPRGTRVVAGSPEHGQRSLPSQLLPLLACLGAIALPLILARRRRARRSL